MKTNTMFNYDLLFGDHMAKVSNQAKLYYIKLNFFAHNGFVTNPMQILDSLGFDKSVFWELVANDEILTLPGRSEVFITSYFVHNHFSPKTWTKSPFAQYWRGKLFTKPNGVATFNPQGETPSDGLDIIQPPAKVGEPEWDALFTDIKGDDSTPKKESDDDLPF